MTRVGDITRQVDTAMSTNEPDVVSTNGISVAEFAAIAAATKDLTPAEWSALDGQIDAPLFSVLKSKGDFYAYAGLMTRLEAEGAVRGRQTKVADATLSVADIAKNSEAFLQGCTQIDGHTKTADDAHICVPAAIVVGLVADDPNVIQRIGNGLDGHVDTYFPHVKEPLKSELVAAAKDFKAGKASPDELRTLMLALYAERRDTSRDGSSDGDAARMYAALHAITRGQLATISLGMFGDPQQAGEGHCRVDVGGRSYTTWPDNEGKVHMQPDGTGISAGEKDGANFHLLATVNLTPTGGSYRSYVLRSDAKVGGPTYHDPSKGEPPLATAKLAIKDGRVSVSDIDTQGIAHDRKIIADTSKLGLYSTAAPEQAMRDGITKAFNP